MAVRLSDVGAIHLVNGRKLLLWLSKFQYYSPKRILVSINERELFKIKLFTNDHVYSMRVTPTYLGGAVSTRKPRPGEEWTRGNDLPDGKFGYETFIRIMVTIVLYEAKDIVEPRQEVPSVEKVVPPE